MSAPNSTASFFDAPLGANASCGGGTATPFSPRHITVAGQAVITASYAVGVAGNAAALAILSRSETARNRKQTLMLRCLAWNDLIALLGMLVQMHLTLYPPSSLYFPRAPLPTDHLPLTPPPLLPEVLGSSSAVVAEGWTLPEGTPSWETASAAAPSSANLLLRSTAAQEAVFEAESSSSLDGGVVGAGADEDLPAVVLPTRTPLPSMGTAHFLCVLRVVWRLFGLGSGCVAIVMAVERWMALTRPFLYQKHVTYNIIKRSVFSLWAAVLVLVFMPFLGFGLYFQPQTRACVRYKMATLPKDIAYAYVFFTFGTLLCICIVCCNLAVIRVLCRVGKKGRGVVRRISRNSLRTSSHSMGATSNLSQKVPNRCNGLAIHMTSSSLPTSASTNNSHAGRHHLLVNLSSATHEELAFARLMAVLCIVFVVCWMPQMISILISQLAPTSKGGRIFSRLADVLMALHFTLDPYIYVLLRCQRRRTCSRAILKMLCHKWRNDEHQPPSTPTGEGTASPLMPMVSPEVNSGPRGYGRPPTKARISTSSMVPVVPEVSSEGLGSDGMRESDIF